MLVENLPVLGGLDSLTVCSVGELNVAVGWVAWRSELLNTVTVDNSNIEFGSFNPNVPVSFQSDDALCNSSLDELVALTLWGADANEKFDADGDADADADEKFMLGSLQK